MHSPGTKWLICRFYWSQFITNIYTVVTLHNQLGRQRGVCLNEWRKKVKTVFAALLLPSGSIRQSFSQRRHIPTLNHEGLWPALLRRSDATNPSGNLCRVAVWSDPHWRQCLVTLSLLPLGVVQSDLGGDHGDCVKAICGGEDWPQPEVPAWRRDATYQSSAGPQCLPLSLLHLTLPPLD